MTPLHLPTEGETIESGPWAGFSVISVYNRKQALADGVLVDVSETAREAGYLLPVALTRAVFDLVEPTEAESHDWLQDLQGRLWDVLFMGRGAAKRAAREGEGRFQLYFRLKGRGDYTDGFPLMTLKVTLDATETGEPAFTISLPEED